MSHINIQFEYYTLHTAVSTFKGVRQAARDKAWTILGIDPRFGEKSLSEALDSDAASALQSRDGQCRRTPLENAAVRLGELHASCQQYAILGGKVEYEKYQANLKQSKVLKAQAEAEMFREIANTKSIDDLRGKVKHAYRRVRKSKPKRLSESMCGMDLVNAQSQTLKWLGSLKVEDQLNYFRAQAFLNWERRET